MNDDRGETEDPGRADDLGPGNALDPPERAVAERLERDRPVPAARFRGALGRHLAASDPGYGPRPERLWTMVVGYLAIGALMIVLGALQATGAL